MGEAAIRYQIEKRSTDAFGRHVWPHLFRAIAATGFVDHAPEEVALVPDLLGHASTQTAHRYYILSTGTLCAQGSTVFPHAQAPAAAARLRNADQPAARGTVDDVKEHPGSATCAPSSTPDILPTFSVTPRSKTRFASAADGSTPRAGRSSRVYSDHGAKRRLAPAGGLSGAAAGRQGTNNSTSSWRKALTACRAIRNTWPALYKQLSFHGVLLVTIGEGEISELHVGLKGAMSALYLKDLAQKTRRGLEGRVRQGRSAGGLSYGYRIVRTIGPDGAPTTGEREIDANEAEVVRRIFADFAAGKSPRAIAKDLNDRGVAGPRGNPWGASTIYGNWRRGTGILNNELYVGRLVWNRQRFVKDPEMNRRQARPNPEDEWVVEEVPALRIVSDELWASVKDAAVGDATGHRGRPGSAV